VKRRLQQQTDSRSIFAQYDALFTDDECISFYGFDGEVDAIFCVLKREKQTKPHKSIHQ
jgi:hypothetical protein